MVHLRTQIKVPKLPKERHQEKTHMKRRADHPITFASSNKAEHRARVFETNALKNPGESKKDAAPCIGQG